MMPSEQPGISDEEREKRQALEFDTRVAMFGFNETTVREDEARRIQAELWRRADLKDQVSDVIIQAAHEHYEPYAPPDREDVERHTERILELITEIIGTREDNHE